MLIGTSTGGPAALDVVLPQLPLDFPWPVLVAQHLPASFTGAFARRLDRECHLKVVEVDQPMLLRPGTVYIGKGDADVMVAPRAAGLIAMPVPAKAHYLWHPSVERMVASALEHFGAPHMIGVMMTGMGNDGAEAMKRLRQGGGRTIAEAESTAIVWGMPGELVKNGGAEMVRPLEDIAATIVDMVKLPCRWLRAAPAARASSGDPSPQRPTLDSSDAESRWTAARALAGHAEAVPELAAALGRETVPRVREAIMTALMRIGDTASVEAILPCLRSQDAGLRAAAIESLQALPEAIAPFMAPLFGDRDSDVRLLATELTRNMKASEATQLLCDLIEREQHPNVCAAAIDVLTEVGTPEAIPALEKCAARFAETPFLPFAISVAIARISGAEG